MCDTVSEAFRCGFAQSECRRLVRGHALDRRDHGFSIDAGVGKPPDRCIGLARRSLEDRTRRGPVHPPAPAHCLKRNARRRPRLVDLPAVPGADHVLDRSAGGDEEVFAVGWGDELEADGEAAGPAARD